MQDQHNVNVSISWPRCKNVLVDGDRISCLLDFQRAYDLMDSYRNSPPPHSQFVNLRGDQDLVKFLERFGPLYLVRKDGSPIYYPRKSLPEVVSSTAVYWEFQRWLTSLLRLIEKLKQGRGVRNALFDFVDADISCYKANRAYRLKPPALAAVSVLKTARAAKSITLPEWLQKADDALIGEAAATMIRASISVEGRLRVTPSNRTAQITARFVIRSLGDALEWMCWQDEFRRRPLLFCDDCGSAFQPPDARKRKFCSYECGHRVAARKWRKNDLLMKRKLKQKNHVNVARVINVSGKDEQ
jgi:hypothetical protein